jgi:hypothetical protein
MVGPLTATEAGAAGKALLVDLLVVGLKISD